MELLQPVHVLQVLKYDVYCLYLVFLRCYYSPGRRMADGYRRIQIMVAERPS